jgi:hypothetical protein
MATGTFPGLVTDADRGRTGDDVVVVTVSLATLACGSGTIRSYQECPGCRRR